MSPRDDEPSRVAVMKTRQLDLQDAVVWLKRHRLFLVRHVPVDDRVT